jgi:hypothetical protein
LPDNVKANHRTLSIQMAIARCGAARWIGQRSQRSLCNSGAIQEEHPLQMSGMRSSARKSEVALIARLALTFRLGIVRSDDLA